MSLPNHPTNRLSAGLPCRRRPKTAPRLMASVVVVLATGSALPARAQNLQQLYEAARGYDATLLSARALLDSAQYRVAQARGLKLPVVGVQLSAGRSLTNTPDQSVLSTAANQANAALSGSQPIYNRVNDVTIAQAGKSLEVTRADFDVADQDLILRVARAYFDVLAAKDTLTTAQSSLTAISEQVASAKRNFEVGSATITDTREAQARFDLARATLIQAENGLVNNRIALDTLVGRSNVEPRPLAVPVVLPTLSPPAVDDWVARAESEHPLVRRALLVLDIARLETDKAKAGRLPTAALTASYGRGYQAGNGSYQASGVPDGVAYTQRGATTSATVGVSVNIPVFSGFQVQNRIRETLVLEDQSLADLNAQRRSVAQATRTAFYGLRSGAAQVNALQAAESSSLLALQATELGYKVGVRVNIDVLNAQAQLYNTQAQLARARYDVVLAGLRLRQASGRVTADDVAALNALLER